MTGKEALKAMIDGEVVDPGERFDVILSMQLGVIIAQDKNSFDNLANTKWDLEMIAGSNGDCDEFSIYKEPEHVFKPFEQVLVRDEDQFEWEINIYGRKNDSHGNEHICLRRMYTQCIPFKGNEHLLGTTEQP